MEVKVFLTEGNETLSVFDRPFYPTKQNEIKITKDVSECDFILCRLTGNQQVHYNRIVESELFINNKEKFVFYVNHDKPEFLYREKDSIKLVAQPAHKKDFIEDYNITTIPLLMTDHLDFHMDDNLLNECRNVEKRYDFIYLGQLYGDRLRLRNLPLDNFLLKATSDIYHLPTDSKKNKIKNYLKELGQGKFGFCPRGGGSNSFRLYECLMVGVVPIITDVIQLPFTDEVNWEEFSIIGSMKNIDELIEKTKTIDYDVYRQKGIDFWEKYCKYYNMNDIIINKIRE
jgi:hypothetical protein